MNWILTIPKPLKSIFEGEFDEHNKKPHLCILKNVNSLVNFEEIFLPRHNFPTFSKIQKCRFSPIRVYPRYIVFLRIYDVQIFVASILLIEAQIERCIEWNNKFRTSISQYTETKRMWI